MFKRNFIKRKMHLAFLFSFRFPAIVSVLSLVAIVYALSEPIKLHPLGDSTTYGYETENCWRYYLYKTLMKEGFDNIDFVGSKNSPTKGKIKDDWDRDHDGHTSQSAHGLLNRIKGWAPKFSPHIVVIYLGTNDIRGRRETDAIINVFTEIIQIYRDARKEIKIVVCQLPYWNWGKGGSKEAVDALNARIPSLKDLGTGISPIKIVDLNTDYHLSDLRDRIHPGVTGAQKIADRVHKAITPWLNGDVTSIHRPQYVTNQPGIKSGLRIILQDNVPARIWISAEPGSGLPKQRGYLITGKRVSAQ